MRHQPIDQLLANATPVEAPSRLSRRERLLRWAELLKREDWRLLQPLKFMEFYAPAERARLRGDQTPLALAFADPVLREDGLKGDRLGQVQAYFRLSEREAHFLLCDCHWRGQMTGRTAARRVRAVANANWFNRLWMELQMT